MANIPKTAYSILHETFAKLIPDEYKHISCKEIWGANRTCLLNTILQAGDSLNAS